MINMNFNLVEMYNGLLRFNKHILNELAEGLKHLPNLDGVSPINFKITKYDWRIYTKSKKEKVKPQT